MEESTEYHRVAAILAYLTAIFDGTFSGSFADWAKASEEAERIYSEGSSGDSGPRV